MLKSIVDYYTDSSQSDAVPVPVSDTIIPVGIPRNVSPSDDTSTDSDESIIEVSIDPQ